MKKYLYIYICFALFCMTLAAQNEESAMQRIDKVASYGIGSTSYRINFNLDSLDLLFEPVAVNPGTNRRNALSVNSQIGTQTSEFTSLVFVEKESAFSKRKLVGEKSTLSEPVYFDSFGTFEIEGVPELPVYRINLPIPDGVDSVWLENINITYNEPVACGKLYPYQNVPESGDYTFTVDSKYYTYSGYDYFGDAVTVSEPYMYHGVRGVTVYIMPVQNNPAQSTVRTIKDVTFDVMVPGMSRIMEKPAKSGGLIPPTDLTDSEAILGPNWWATNPSVNPPVYSDPIIWFLTTRRYAQKLDYYVKYKKHLGFDTKVFLIEDIGNTSTAIRDFLRTQYNTYTLKPKYLLIVGSPADIQYSAGVKENIDNPPTDIYYSCLEKASISEESLTPEFALGRWPVRSVEDLQNIINKSIKYEATVSGFDIDDLNIMLLSGTGDYDYIFIKNVKNLQNILMNNGLKIGTVYDGRGCSSSDIQTTFKSNIQNNMWMFVYQGHGGYNIIGSPLNLQFEGIFNYDNKFFLQCIFKPIPPISLSFACLTNDNVKNSSHSGFCCIGERWLCEKDNVGGVIHFGASTISYINSNQSLSKKIIQQFNDKNNYTIGSIIDHGEMEYCQYNTISQKNQIKKYNLFGDPSLRVRGNRLAWSYSNRQSKTPKFHGQSSENDKNYNFDIKGNTISINHTDKISSVFIYDIWGRIIVAENYLSLGNTSDFTLENGIYMVVIKTESGDIYTEKFIVKH